MTSREPSRRRPPVRVWALAAIVVSLLAASALLLTPGSTGRSRTSRPDGPSVAAQPASPTSAHTAGRVPSSSSPSRPAVGVQLHGMWDDYSDAQRLAMLDKITAAHLQWVRIDMGWSSFEEPCRGCYSGWYLERANLLVDAARQRGLKVLVTVWRTPGWASDGAGELAPPTSPTDFGRFMGWLAGQFRGRISAYEIWNEPDSRDFYTGTVDQYAALVRAAYPAVKSADPGTEVVLGGPIHNNTSWLRSVYRAGARGSFDVLATHPYMSPSDLPPETPDLRGVNSYLLTHVAAVHRLMAANGDGDKPIWFTEMGWSSHPNTGDESNWDRGVTLQQQADYTIRAIQLVRSKFPYVTNMILYNERDRATGDVQLDNYGILRRDLSEKPVYKALRGYLAV